MSCLQAIGVLLVIAVVCFLVACAIYQALRLVGVAS